MAFIWNDLSIWKQLVSIIYPKYILNNLSLFTRILYSLLWLAHSPTTFSSYQCKYNQSTDSTGVSISLSVGRKLVLKGDKVSLYNQYLPVI